MRNLQTSDLTTALYCLTDDKSSSVN